MIHFDIDERYLDDAAVESAISRPESVIVSVVVHAAIFVAIIFGPRLPLFRPSPEALQAAEQLRLQQQERERQNKTFVFVKPRVDLQSPKPPQRGEDSDVNRIARAPQVAPNPTNPLPYSRGNSSERVEESAAREARGVPDQPPAPEPQPPVPQASRDTLRLPQGETGYLPPRETSRMAGGSRLGDALKNLQRYVQNGSFDNTQGGANQPGAAIQFDTKGVEFGPWIRRFVAQVKRNWFVPNAAYLLKGHVVLQFNIHRDGHISDIAVVGPSQVDAFNNAAYNAILTSNPTEPLPPEYPTEKALFTVTFFYNEEPPNF